MLTMGVRMVGNTDFGSPVNSTGNAPTYAYDLAGARALVGALLANSRTECFADWFIRGLGL